VSFVRTTFSESPDVLADFGLEPKKASTPLTAQQKAAASQSALRHAKRGTRWARCRKRRLLATSSTSL